MKYKVGDILIITPPAHISYANDWLGVRCLVQGIDKSSYRTVALTKPPDPYKRGALLYWGEDWVRLEKSLSPLEELIAAYVEAQKAELGI